LCRVSDQNKSKNLPVSVCIGFHLNHGHCSRSTVENWENNATGQFKLLSWPGHLMDSSIGRFVGHARSKFFIPENILFPQYGQHLNISFTQGWRPGDEVAVFPQITPQIDAFLPDPIVHIKNGCEFVFPAVTKAGYCYPVKAWSFVFLPWAIVLALRGLNFPGYCSWQLIWKIGLKYHANRPGAILIIALGKAQFIFPSHEQWETAYAKYKSPLRLTGIAK